MQVTAREKYCPSWTIAANLETIFQITFLTVSPHHCAPGLLELCTSVLCLS